MQSQFGAKFSYCRRLTFPVLLLLTSKLDTATLGVVAFVADYYNPAQLHARTHTMNMSFNSCRTALRRGPRAVPCVVQRWPSSALVGRPARQHAARSVRARYELNKWGDRSGPDEDAGMADDGFDKVRLLLVGGLLECLEALQAGLPTLNALAPCRTRCA